MSDQKDLSLDDLFRMLINRVIAIVREEVEGGASEPAASDGATPKRGPGRPRKNAEAPATPPANDAAGAQAAASSAAAAPAVSAATGAKPPTIDDVRAAFLAFIQLEGNTQETGRPILKEFGAGKMTELKPEDFPKVLARLAAATAAHKKPEKKPAAAADDLLA